MEKDARCQPLVSARMRTHPRMRTHADKSPPLVDITVVLPSPLQGSGEEVQMKARQVTSFAMTWCSRALHAGYFSPNIGQEQLKGRFSLFTVWSGGGAVR